MFALNFANLLARTLATLKLEIGDDFDDFSQQKYVFHIVIPIFSFSIRANVKYFPTFALLHPEEITKVRGCVRCEIVGMHEESESGKRRKGSEK